MKFTLKEVFLVVALILQAGPAAAAPVPVATCGETVTDAVLVADLDCSAASGFAVTITNGGRLDLAGHRLTGTATYQDPALGGGVYCQGECTIAGGGGAIVAPPGIPALSWYSYGVVSRTYNPLDLKPLRDSRMTFTDIEVSGWNIGIEARSVDIRNCTLTANGYGMNVTKSLTMEACTVTGNTVEAVHVYKGTIRNSTFSGNEAGIYNLRRLELIDSSITGNRDYGYSIKKLRAIRSDLTGNCTAPASTHCADIYARHHPVLIDSTCGTSRQAKYGVDWYGTPCSLD